MKDIFLQLDKLKIENKNMLTLKPTQMFKFLHHRTFFGKPFGYHFCKSKRGALFFYFLFWYAPHLLLPRHTYVPSRAYPKLDKDFKLHLLSTNEHKTE